MIRAAFNCVVIVIHHCGVEGTRPRGHTSLTGAADTQISVKRNRGDNIVVTVEFMKDGLEGDQIVSLLEQTTVGTDDDGDPITSCVIRPVELSATKARPPVTGRAAIALRVLHDAIAEAGETPRASDPIPPNVKSVSADLWRSKFYAAMEKASPSARQKAFVRAAQKLDELNLVGKFGDQIWLA